MKLFWLTAATLLVSGCGERTADAASDSRGRYLGLGTFTAGRLWSQMKIDGRSTDPAAANLADDEHIIVVIDSHTGEVRQCGDYSGICARSNPWTDTSVAAAPIPLAKHAADLVREAEANATEAKR